MNESHRRKILDVLHAQQLAVIATVDPDTPTPESALIAFAEDDRLHVYFQTGTHTRKAQNLQKNPHVSLVIGLNKEDGVTVQYEGRARRLSAPDELEACKQRFIAKGSPTTEEYFNHPTTIFFAVEPTWIGCSDYSGAQPEVIELFGPHAA